MKLRNIILAVLCILTISLSSCNDFLDVTSKTQVRMDEQFTTEAGFRDVLIGVYLQMADNKLYGANLTWRFAEILSMNYAIITSHSDAELWNYNYKAYNQYSEIFQNLYRVIEDCNILIDMAEKNPNVMSPLLDSIVRGEAYALRAFFHLDILRWYGKGNLSGRNLFNEKALPYITKYSKDVTPSITYDEYLKCIENDCLKAIALLEADPQKSIRLRPQTYYSEYQQDQFISTTPTLRKSRMNYYAACGVLARAKMWDGRPEALKMAQKYAEIAVGVDVYGDANLASLRPTWWTNAGSAGFRNNTDPYQNDKGFVRSEPLFDIYLDLAAAQSSTRNPGGFFDTSAPSNTFDILCLNATTFENIFEYSKYTADFRSKFILPEGSYYTIYKYKWIDKATGKKGSELATRPDDCNRLALIRPTEMMFIIAECALKDGDKAKCAKYLSAVNQWRNIPANAAISATLSDEAMEKEIMKEYRKDLLCEGQTFLYYKRQGYKNIDNYSFDMTDLEYVLPLPEDEEILAGRTVVE